VRAQGCAHVRDLQEAVEEVHRLQQLDLRRMKLDVSGLQKRCSRRTGFGHDAAHGTAVQASNTAARWRLL
jgi:hypothetical protein